MTEAADAGPPVDPNRHVYGEVSATMTVLEYGDFECPYCGAAAPVLRRLVDLSDGAVRLVFRHFPIFLSHPFALTAALAAEASGERFWAMHDELFAHQDRLADVDLQRYADRIGSGAVTGDEAQVFRGAVEADYATGAAANVRGTPTLFVDGTLYTGRVELSALRGALGIGH